MREGGIMTTLEATTLAQLRGQPTHLAWSNKEYILKNGYKKMGTLPQMKEIEPYVILERNKISLRAGWPKKCCQYINF